jgi:hypothetical protein
LTASPSVIFPTGDVLPVVFEPVGQLSRAAEGDEVPAVHSVGGDAETLSHDPALELRREEAVVAG